jgi:thiamine-phosphate pyrophosphorylase
MTRRCLLYYITDRKAFSENEPERSRRVLEKIAEAARAGVDYIQLREKDLSTRELESLAREAVKLVHLHSRPGTPTAEPPTRLLINSRTDVALSTAADGVHLRSDDISPSELRKIWQQRTSGLSPREQPSDPTIAISCHSPEDVAEAASHGATLAVFAPVFEKKNLPGAEPAGLERLREACRHTIPVLALGGATLDNAASCLAAGAAGIAAIRLFQENDIAGLIQRLR